MKKITDYLEKEKIDRLLQMAMYNDRDYLMLRILWRTGMRAGEATSFTPADVEPHNSVINIVKAKGNKQRRVVLDSETMDLLMRYIDDRAPDRSVFPITTRHLWLLVKRYGAMIGEDIHPHTLRHSYAINCLRHGMDIRRLQLLLGHSNLNTTQVYLQFNDSDVPRGVQ